MRLDQKEEGPELAPLECVLNRRAVGQELPQIGAGAEGVAGGGDDDGGNRRVLPSPQQRRIQGPNHRRPKGVADLRLVQPQGEDAVPPALDDLVNARRHP